ncbi:MAG TPA: STAS domain-containing protein [Anaeromyxobacteraceae bacterium]|nr:STAS domain-containing protein [Anaeromyxobacteraceae bacterium]
MEKRQETQVIRPDGMFDLAAAQDVARRLAGVPSGALVRVDLTRVRDLDDLGVALLARALAESPGRVAVQGLRQHHRRLLRYLGIEAAEADPAPA